MTERTEDMDFLRFRESGDPEAMARVFDAVAPKLLIVAAHLARGSSQAEDLVQTTFLCALRDAHRWDGKRPLVPWLLGILSHRALDELRRSRHLGDARELPSDLEGALDPADVAADHDLQEAIARAVDGVGEPYREVLALRLAHGLAPAAIGHALGRSPGTVRVQLQRGLVRAVIAPRRAPGPLQVGLFPARSGSGSWKSRRPHFSPLGLGRGFGSGGPWSACCGKTLFPGEFRPTRWGPGGEVGSGPSLIGIRSFNSPPLIPAW